MWLFQGGVQRGVVEVHGGFIAAGETPEADGCMPLPLLGTIHELLGLLLNHSLLLFGHILVDDLLDDASLILADCDTSYIAGQLLHILLP